MNLKAYILQRQEQGYCFFTSGDAVKHCGSAVKQAIHRAQQRGEVVTPLAGFHVIISPEYRKSGCIPPDQFISDLMMYIGSPYYVCLLSAAQYYGATHQRPQIFQVMTDKARRPIVCGKVRIEFVTNKMVEKLPVQKFNTVQGFLKISTPELTALDLVCYPEKAAGMDNAFNVIIELAEKIDPIKLVALLNIKKEITWLQRLGYLFELAEKPMIAGEIEKELKNHRLRKRPLSVYNEITPKTPFDDKWKLWLNEELEVEV